MTSPDLTQWARSLEPFGVRIYNDPTIGYFVEARVTA